MKSGFSTDFSMAQIESETCNAQDAQRARSDAKSARKRHDSTEHSARRGILRRRRGDAVAFTDSRP
jgi:hypothetical protein